MFFAALTSASKMLPQLVQTKRDRLMRLAASRDAPAWPTAAGRQNIGSRGCSESSSGKLEAIASGDAVPRCQ
jgi:hypothetical protein